MTAGDSSHVHVDLEVLADLAGDVRDDAQTRAARAHIGTCERCTATYDALLALPATIAATAAAESIPTNVALRIDAAIVRASQDRVAAATASPTPIRPRRRAGVASWVLGTAAAAAAAVVATVVLTNGMAPGDTSLADKPDSGSAAGSENTQRVPDRTPTAESVTPDSSAPTATTAPASDLDSEVLALIAEVEATKTSTKVSGSDGRPTQDSDPYVGCTAAVTASTGRSAVPIAGELTTYEGKSAVLLVFTHRGDDASSSVDAYVLPASCLSLSAGTSSVAPILRQTTVHR